MIVSGAYTAPFVVLNLESGDEIEFDGQRYIVHGQRSIMGKGKAKRLVEHYELMLFPIADDGRIRFMTIYARWRSRQFKTPDPEFDYKLIEKTAWKSEWIVE